jgi:hypothetical protein
LLSSFQSFFDHRAENQLTVFIGFDAIKIQLSIEAHSLMLAAIVLLRQRSSVDSKWDDEFALRGNIACTMRVMY